MMPMVFCASLPPWPRLYKDDEMSCSLRNKRSTRLGVDALAAPPLAQGGGAGERDQESGKKIEDGAHPPRMIGLGAAGKPRGRDGVPRGEKAVQEGNQPRPDHNPRQYAEAQLAGSA